VILRAFSNYEFSIRTTLVDDRIIAAEASFEGMNDGPLSLPSGEVPATGRRLKFDLAFFSRLDESGKIVEERRYYDVADQLTQLGLA
jgi:predicted ester cyclase